MAKLRIGIDARLYGPTDRGLGRYTAELLATIEGQRQTFDFVIFCRTAEQRQQLSSQGWTTILAPFRPYSFGEQWHYPKTIKQASVDVMHFTHFNVPVLCAVPYIVTIHDLILHHFPNRRASKLGAFHYWLKYLAFRLAFRWTVERARLICCVSDFTAEDLATLFPQVRTKISVIKELTPQLQPFGDNDRNMFLSYTNKSSFVGVVGAFYPHKNIERLVKCWARLRDEGMILPDLRLVGSADSWQAKIENQAKECGLLNVAGGVHFVGYLSDEDLATFYKSAQAVVVPSLWEGVGLVGWEALAQGTPVMSSAAAGLPEAYGRSVKYLAVESDEAMLTSLRNLLNKNDKIATPPTGITRAEMANLFLANYQKFLNAD
jgi:glycosyltransferase involved in cell wall biosynthesis